MRASRLPALDCLRGLMLFIVLTDHIDFVGSIRAWTPIGLGFSDAADVFVFLSGFTFGYAYGKRIEKNGIGDNLRHGLRRVAQIYTGFIVCVLYSGMLELVVGTTDLSTQYKRWVSSIYFVYQPPNTSILCLYIVLIPWLLLLMIVFNRRSWWAPLAISLALYVIAQFSNGYENEIPGGSWRFQPFSWQLLMVFAALLGRRFYASGTTGWLRSRTLFGTAIVILLFGLAVRKLGWSLNSAWILSYQWTGKPNWAPLRALHHLSLVYATVYILPLSSGIWSSRPFEALRACGRHSLSIYCFGVIFAESATAFFQHFGGGPIDVVLLVLNAVAIQCLIALLLDRRCQRSEGEQGRLDLLTNAQEERLRSEKA